MIELNILKKALSSDRALSNDRGGKEMGNQLMPTVADFLDIQPVTPELIRRIGYLPQCTFWDGKPAQSPRGCPRQSEWTVESNYRCTVHKDEIVQLWETMIKGWTTRPAEAQDSDLELLELIRGEFTEHAARYVHVIVGKVVKDLSLPDTPAGRNLAAWYLWEMGVFNIYHRTAFYEQS